MSFLQLLVAYIEKKSQNESGRGCSGAVLILRLVAVVWKEG